MSVQSENVTKQVVQFFTFLHKMCYTKTHQKKYKEHYKIAPRNIFCLVSLQLFRIFPITISYFTTIFAHSKKSPTGIKQERKNL